MSRIIDTFVIIAILASMLASCSSISQQSGPVIWEYKVVHLTTEGTGDEFAAGVEVALNELGKNSWECTTNLVPFSGFYAYCKRPKL